MEINDKTRQAMAFASGGLIVLAAFTLVLWLLWHLWIKQQSGSPGHLVVDRWRL